ncbi:hypothetical protein RHMOL_Rhmol10G0035100 [Rhododendron molle]|uniref:Uncharacterized protein n=1 Tax=Rhododendron molle TaxID=49168 RepID=A0ACC0M096_RHOML|nr:hypothetical protein RHMOL_Rhmol10G0035100 [Rhododendron molle]
MFPLSKLTWWSQWWAYQHSHLLGHDHRDSSDMADFRKDQLLLVAKNYSWPWRITHGHEKLLLTTKNYSWPQGITLDRKELLLAAILGGQEQFVAARSNYLQPRVSSNDEESLTEVSGPSHSPVGAPAPAQAKLPAKAPAPVPSVKPPVLPPPPAKKPQIECNPLCVGRCKLHSRKQVCLRTCMTCCDRCKCVPPGTYGNREKCGKCYTDMTTTGGRPKCP